MIVHGITDIEGGAAGGGERPDDRRIAVLVHPVVGAEEPQPVLDEKSAELGAASARLDTSTTCVVQAGRWSRVLSSACSAPPSAKPNSEPLNVLLPALGDDVDDAAGHAAVLGRQAARLDFDFLDEVEVERLALVAELDTREQPIAAACADEFAP